MLHTVILAYYVASCLSIPSPIIQTEQGQVQGLSESYRGVSVNSYIGIPYAQPPLGSLRFKTTQPHTPWTGVKNTSTFSPICPQVPSNAYTFPPHYVIDEDCLTLNVWAPAANSTTKRAVLVWIHGGGFQNGGNVELRERGGDMAAIGDVVVVVINYRLGILGFLAIPPMFEETKEIGNWGLKDQVYALGWVNRNIANFGGDPSRVTIFGESAGGSAMGMHLAMPASYPYFHQAIIESGAPFIELLPLNISLTLGIASTIEVGCFDRHDVLECMRAHPWKGLLRELPPDIFPTIDGSFLPLNPYSALEKGSFAKVPIMIGDVSGEFWQAVGAVFLLPLTVNEYHDLVHLFVGPKLAKEVLELYPCEAWNATDCRAVLGEMFSDFVLSCPTSLTGEFFANASLPVYAFEFTRRASWIGTPPHQGFQTGAPHASEIEFVWSTTNIHNSTPAEQNLALSMTQYWTNFAKYGNPNGGNSSLLKWPAYVSPNYSRFRFDLPSSVKDGYNEPQCEFWKPIYAFYANLGEFPFPAGSLLSKAPFHRMGRE